MPIVKNASCHSDKKEQEKVMLLARKMRVWVEFISGMLCLAVAELYKVSQSTVCSVR